MTRRPWIPGPFLVLAASMTGCLPGWPEQHDGQGDAEMNSGADGLPPLPPTPPPTTAGDGPWTDDGPGQTTGSDDGGNGHGDGDDGDADTGADEGETGGDAGPADVPGADPSSAQLRLRQVLPDPAGKDGAAGGPEFIEIHNPGPGPASLVGVSLRATSWPDVVLDDTWLESTSLTEDQSLVIFRFSSDSPLPSTPAAATSIVGSGGLRNADGVVALVDATDEVLDVLVYGAPSTDPLAVGWNGPAAPDPGADEAFCRTDAPPGPGAVGSTGPEGWVICSPRPGDMVVAGPGPLRITEVSPGIAGDANGENAQEFIELINESSNTVELGGWLLRVDGSDEPLELIAAPSPCSPAPCVAPDDRLLLVHDDYAGAFGDAGIVVTDDGRLGATGLDGDSTVELVRPDGAVASSHRRWSVPSDPPRVASIAQSLNRPPGDPDTPDAWTLAAPSPGT